MEPRYKTLIIFVNICVFLICCTCLKKTFHWLISPHHSKFNEQELLKTSDEIKMKAKITFEKSNELLLTRDQYSSYLSLFFGSWKTLISDLTKYWWITIVSTLLPLFMYWRFKCNIRIKFSEWKTNCNQNKQNEKNNSRRLTLPDLTLAKHARRESMIDKQKKLYTIDRQQSISNATTELNLSRKWSFDRGEDMPSEKKRTHLIRRY
ncbi:uncharacterized protein LOC126908649 isoform X1 [Daktulosphaira vitifoliae]|uniref:uncharacterized protein LOC126908649 isoform X1 n=1 Tax=Daktulosphaira vitifoliae TaxID=58002 RepID=UPI0021AAA352|nr:uncharacterized protein LOC126908649 isoform X1 [Daktulosphaira vitifoliae]